MGRATEVDGVRERPPEGTSRMMVFGADEGSVFVVSPAAGPVARLDRDDCCG